MRRTMRGQRDLPEDCSKLPGRSKLLPHGRRRRGRLLPSRSSYSLRPHFPFQLSRFQLLALLPPSGFSFQLVSILVRGQSSNVRWVCCWREVISIRHRTIAGQVTGPRLLTCRKENLRSDPFNGPRKHIPG
jgi:hypothetical protein